MRALVILAGISTIFVTFPAGAAPGDLDPAFGSGGIARTDIGGIGKLDVLHAIAIQSDGMIVAVGDSANDFAVVRYETDGDLDPTFGGGDGVVVTPIGVSDDEAFGVAIQTDGKIVVVGRAIPTGVSYDFAVVRYETDGDPDPTFGGGDGMVTTGGLDDEYANDVTLQADGKIVVAGFTGDESNTRFAVLRYGTDGQLDATFSADGIATTNFSRGNDYAYSVALQPDGRIVAAGSRSVTGLGDDIALARYTSTGSLDGTFANKGKQSTPVTLAWDYANDVTVLGSGKILVAGCANCFEGKKGGSFALLRYRSGGGLDPRFAVSGIRTTQFSSGDDIAYGIGVLSDGRIAVGGCSACFENQDLFAIARFLRNGTPDLTFSGNGKVETDIGPGVTGDTGQAIAVQGDDAAVLAGCAACYSSTSDFAVVRYLP